MSLGEKISFFILIRKFEISFTFIGLRENWATKINEDILNMPGYNHEHCSRSYKKKEGLAYNI